MDGSTEIEISNYLVTASPYNILSACLLGINVHDYVLLCKYYELVVDKYIFIISDLRDLILEFLYDTEELELISSEIFQIKY